MGMSNNTATAAPVMMINRWIVGAQPRQAAWFSANGEFVTFADAPTETCRKADYQYV